ncbi:MAG: 3-hydroxyacyl-CoA dehydrogenase NAD-binding domain-containing protein [Deferrisomatales bacterium]|nr:3-hydroxyacyl-CoA dehydrogenase NAD-binding domain-containing protein [Deferrisomatales bacterium]
MAKLKKIGVVGAGNMGSGIVQKLAQEGFAVVMQDLTSEFVARGRSRIRTLLGEAVERKIFKPEQVEEILARIYDTTDLKELADCDYVIEAVFEDETVKKELFAGLGDLCGPETVLATNTSSFYVTHLAEAAKRPERVVGLHFFYHPAKNRLVEVIPGAKTSAAAVDASLELAKRMGKVPILCKDRPGFVVNRFFVPWLNEAVRLLEKGVADIPTIEAAAKKAFRIGMGPFELMNVTGVPIAYHAEATLGRELGGYYPPVALLKAQAEKNEPWNLAGTADDAKFQQVADRLMGVVFQVAGELLDEEVASLEDVDQGAKIGLLWALGPFELMNKVGTAKAVALAETFCAEFGHPLAKSLSARKASGSPWPIQVVQLAVKDGIATLRINRPEALNALNEAVVEQLEAAFDDASARADVKAIVIEGAGKAFVAGADIKFFIDNIEAGRVPKIGEFARRGQRVLRKLETSLKPVIAKVDGLSLGGGTELALACQAIVATEKAGFGFPETSIGIFPGLGGTQRTARIVGKELGKYLVFTGAPLDGKTAHEIGLAAYYVPSAEADAFIRNLAAKGAVADKYAKKPVPAGWEAVVEAFSDQHIGEVLGGRAPSGDPRVQAAAKAIPRKAPLAVCAANEILDEGMTVDLPAGLELELSRLEEIFRTADALTGLKSVGVSRPEFKGA